MKKQITKKHRNDAVLIACVLLVAAGLLVYLNFFRTAGNCITVTVDGNEYGVYSLTENTAVDIYTGEDRQQHNRLIIQDSKAFMESASCPDGICVAHKPVFRDGESIICLPNRVVVTVHSADKTETPDIIM